MKIITRIALAAALAGSAVSAQAAVNLIKNGSFETINGTPVAGILQVTGPNSTAVQFWAVAASSQFKVNTNYNASAGDNSVSLSGTGGALFQSVSGLTIGKTYKVSFDLSGDPTATVDPLVRVSVSSIGNLQTFAFDTPFGQTNALMGWTRVATSFIATATLHRVAFTNANAAADRPRGGAIDNVIMAEAVPEPATWAMLLTGFGMVGVAARRRRTAVA